MLTFLANIFKTAFFLQGSFALSYVPLTIIIVTFLIRRIKHDNLLNSFLIAMQVVVTAYFLVIVLTAVFGFILTYFDYALSSPALMPAWHYDAAVLINIVVYAIMQLLFFSVHSKRLAGRSLFIVVVSNGIAAAVIILLHLLLFVR